MNTTELRDERGFFIGKIIDSGHKKDAYGRDGFWVGRYERANDTTYDQHGRIVGRGDLLAALVYGH